MKPNDLHLSTTVDRLALLNSQIADLETEALGLKEILIASGQPSIVGMLFKAAVKFNEPKPLVDYKGIVTDLEVCAATLAQYMKPRTPFFSVALYGR